MPVPSNYRWLFEDSAVSYSAYYRTFDTASTEGWSLYSGGTGATIDTDDTEGHDAIGSLKIVTGADGLGGWDDTTQPAVTPGNTYTVSAWVKASNTSQNMNLYLQWWDDGPTIVSTSGPDTISTDGDWQFFTVTGVAPGGATHIRPIVRWTSTQAGTIWVDDTEITESAAASAGSYRVPINPNKMTNPIPQRTLSSAQTIRKHWRIREDKPSTPEEWTFSGVIRDIDHHDALLLWSKKQNSYYISDHLGRRFHVASVKFNVDEKRPSARISAKFDYDFTVLVLGWEYV